jgi:hypothetical protein
VSSSSADLLRVFGLFNIKFRNKGGILMIRTGSFSRTSIWSKLPVLLVLCAAPVFGKTITVTNTNDSGPGSLRQAIADSASGDTITFSVTGTITLASTLTIDSSQPKTLTILGGRPLLLSISGGDQVPVFIVQPLVGQGGAITLTISELSIVHGSSNLGAGIENNGTLTLNNCSVERHNTTLNGGPVLGGAIANLGALTLNNTDVGFSEAEWGGGIYNLGTLTLNNSTVVSNRAIADFPNTGRGGGIYNASNGTVNLNNSWVENNEADLSEGGGPLFGVGFGGGIFNEQGIVTLTKSTVSNNRGGGNIPDCCALSGAGIFNGGQLFLFNSTVAGNNTPAVGGNGAGIANFGSVTLSNSTVANNTAIKVPSDDGFHIDSGLGGGIVNGSGGNATLKNSILANNIGGNCFLSDTASQSSLGHNLSDDSSCASFLTVSGDLDNTPAGLDPNGLQNNGGPTPTVALQSTSPAVDAIPANPNPAVSFCTDTNGQPVTTDQRGVRRPQGPACDIGAYEFFKSRLIFPAVQTYQILDAVLALPVPPDTQSGLIAPLQGAIISINAGNTNPAVGQLGAFINETNGLVRGGVLTQEQATPLTTAAQGVIQTLRDLGS